MLLTAPFVVHEIDEIWCVCVGRGEQVRAAVRGAGRAAAAVGARAQLLRGAHHALRRRALALHHGRLRLQGLHTKRNPAQTGRRAQPRWSLRPATPEQQSSLAADYLYLSSTLRRLFPSYTSAGSSSAKF